MRYTFEYWRGGSGELSPGDRELAAAASEAAGEGHAPFTGFRVGAAARLGDGRIETSSNRESPIGSLSVCAERRLLYALRPGDVVEAFAVAAERKGECYPCGVCRQALVEKEQAQGAPIRVIMAGRDSAVVVPRAADLLPFTYEYGDTLRR